MIPWVELGRASVPGGGELRLMQRGGEYSIMAGAIELMNSRLSGSEEALANLSVTRLAGLAAPHVLIGGLGMGFTLRAALAALGADAAVTVAELVPEVVAWARGPMAALHGASLTDPRVTIVEGDVGKAIGETPARFDAILLDVDNGPEGLTRAENDDLYDAYGLRQAALALRPGGVMAVWSVSPNPEVARRFAAAGFSVEELRVRASRTGRGARHVIWIGVKA